MIRSQHLYWAFKSIDGGAYPFANKDPSALLHSEVIPCHPRADSSCQNTQLQVCRGGVSRIKDC